MKNKKHSLKVQSDVLTFFTVTFTIFTLVYSFGIIFGILADYQTVGKWFYAHFEFLDNIFGFSYEEPFYMLNGLGINPAMICLPILLAVLNQKNREEPIVNNFSVIAAFLLWVNIGRFLPLSIEVQPVIILVRYSLLAALLIYNTVKYHKRLKTASAEEEKLLLKTRENI